MSDRAASAGADAASALAAVQVAPREALRLAEQALLSARRARDRSQAAVALRAMGLASLYSGDLEGSVGQLRAAVADAARSGSPLLRAESRMSLAFALSRRGRSAQALHVIDRALTDLGGVQRARALAQRAAIYQQLGRLDEARDGYRLALVGLRRADDKEWIQRCLSNRAVLHTFQGAFAAAESDLEQARGLCEELQLTLASAFVEENLAFVSARKGDVPAALKHSHEAECRYRDLRAPIGSLLVDRAELLLATGLAAEASESAARAVEALSCDHQAIAVPEARLLVARAAAVDGSLELALAESRRSAREFARQGRRSWVALATLETLSTALALDPDCRFPWRRAAAVADTLGRADWPRAALDARLLLGSVALARGRCKDAEVHLLVASRQRSRGPAVLRARGWYAEALLRLAHGRRRATMSAVAAGLRILDDYRATLVATDLRAHVSALTVELADLAVRMAVEDGDAKRALCCAELGRAQHLLTPVRPGADTQLVRLLAELRSTVAELDRRRGRQAVAASLRRRQVELERAVRDHCRRRSAAGEAFRTRPPSVPRLVEALGDDAALVEFLTVHGAWYAVTVARGRVSLTRLDHAQGVHDLVRRAGYALRRLSGGQAAAASRQSAGLLLRAAAAELDRVLLRPLHSIVGGRALVVVPTGCLHSVPWSVLPSCVARPVTVAPSAAMWLSARAVTAAPASPGRRVVAAAGPGLSGARTEAAAVARTYGSGALMLAGEEATVTSVIAALRGSDVAHLAAHGRLRVDNPLFSALEFADGPLTVYDLEQLDALPHTVVLASCESVKSAQWAGDELIGLAATFLSRRTAQLIGSVVPVPDAETVPLMVALHRSLADGLPAAEALAGAQRSLLDPHSPSYAAAAGFVCVGAGLALPHPRSSGRDSHGLGELSVPRQVPVQQDRRPMSAGRRAEHAGE